MLNFKFINIALFISLLITGVFIYVRMMDLYVLLVPLFIYQLFIVYGSFNIQSNFFAPAYSKGNMALKQVAITFDDGPHPTNTFKVLETLALHKAQATFFVIGKKIAGNESLIKKIDEANHIIGNHTYSHSFFIDFKNQREFENEIKQTNHLINEITGKQMMLFRPPYGVTTPSLAKACQQLKMEVIGWNIRSLDTRIKDKKKLAQRVKKQIKPGAIILFHDTIDGIEIALEEVLLHLKENNYEVVNLSQLLNIKAYG